MTTPTWGLVATVDEPVQLLVAWAGWHLAQGASEVSLYLDRPTPEDVAQLEAIPGCTVVACDQAYWDATNEGRRPKSHMSRQTHNANHAYRRTTLDWLMHCDGDEFVRDPAALAEALAAAGPEVTNLRLGVLERTRASEAPGDGIFDGVFRRPDMGLALARDEIYGRWTKFLAHGLSGHDAGKTIARTGQDIFIAIHVTRTPPPERRIIPPSGELADQLLHFDGLTRLHLVLKMLRRLELADDIAKLPPQINQRIWQVRYAVNHTAKSKQMTLLVSGLQELDPAQRAALDGLGQLWTEPFDPGPALARLGLAPDLSVAGFDAVLRARDAHLITRHDLEFP